MKDAKQIVFALIGVVLFFMAMFLIETLLLAVLKFVTDYWFILLPLVVGGWFLFHHIMDEEQEEVKNELKEKK